MMYFRDFHILNQPSLNSCSTVFRFTDGARGRNLVLLTSYMKGGKPHSTVVLCLNSS